MSLPLRALGRAALDWLLPPACAGCRAALVTRAPHEPGLPDALCPRCRGRVVWSSPGEVVPVDPALIAELRVGASYQGVVEEWLRRFKYRGTGPAGLSPAPAAATEALLLHALAQLEGGAPRGAPLADVIVPIPSPRRRIRERGFQPTAVLARAAAAWLHLPIAWDALRARGARPSQTGLSRSARRRNAARAFVCGRAPVAGATLLLVDDVVTTGATLESAARTLRGGAAERILAVCAARARLEDV